jgi:DNA-binding MarR family transcriptional regulator
VRPAGVLRLCPSRPSVFADWNANVSPIIRRLELIRQADLTGYEKLVLLFLSDHIGTRTDGWFIKQEDLAQECGISRHTVMRTVRSLVERGVLDTEERGRRKALLYSINERKLAALVVAPSNNGKAGAVATSNNGAVAGSYSGQLQRATTSSSSQLQLTPSGLPQQTSPERKLPPRGGQAPPSSQEEIKDEQVMENKSTVEALIQEVAHSLKQSSETTQKLRDAFNRDIYPAMRRISGGLDKSADMLNAIRRIARSEFAGKCSLGAIICTPDGIRRLLEAYQEETDRGFATLDSYAAQVARGHQDAADLELSPEERVYVLEKADEYKRQADERKRQAEQAAAEWEAGWAACETDDQRRAYMLTHCH